MFFVSPENEFIQVENEISVKADLFEDLTIHLFFTLLEPVENQLKTSTPLFIVRPQNSLLWLFGGDKRIWNDLYGGRKEQRWRVWHSSQIRNRKEEEMDREYKAWQTKRKI